MATEKCKCQYYDEVSQECGYHGCPITKEMKEKCDVENNKRKEKENEGHERYPCSN